MSGKNHRRDCRCGVCNPAARSPRPSEPPETRFWRHVDKSGECWTWRSGQDRDDYPSFNTGGGRIVEAHVYAYERARGPVPPGKAVCHTCNNKRCVRDEHLYLATKEQNTRDAWRDGLIRHRDWGTTHCRRGHEFTVENTYITTKGRRCCRTCDRARRAKAA